jgi:hypothetical protein
MAGVMAAGLAVLAWQAHHQPPVIAHLPRPGRERLCTPLLRGGLQPVHAAVDVGDRVAEAALEQLGHCQARQDRPSPHDVLTCRSVSSQAPPPLSSLNFFDENRPAA